MRILIFNWRDIKNPKAGGAEIVLHENAKRWVWGGHDVTLFTSAFPSSMEEETIEGIKIIRKGGKFTVYGKAFRNYQKYFRDEFDVVIDAINSIPFFTPLYVKKPVVSLIFQLTREAYFKLIPRFLALVGYVVEPYLLNIYKRFPAVVLSRSIKEELAAVKFKKDKIFVVEPGVNHEENFEPGEKSTQPTILYLNRVVSYKNPDHLIKAFQQVKREIPNAKLTMAGFRGTRYEEKLKLLANRLGVTKDIEFLGFAKGREKKELLQRAWVHVLPSNREGWGISVTEAAACGTPTIGYDVVGLRDSIKQGKTGILVPFADVNSLAQANLKILTDTQLRKNLSEGALKYAQQFSWDKSAQKFEQILEKVVNSHYA